MQTCQHNDDDVAAASNKYNNKDKIIASKADVKEAKSSAKTPFFSTS